MMKKITMAVVVLVLLVLVPVAAQAEYDDLQEYAPSASYTIQAYDIDMVVNDDRTFDITETITQNYHEEAHGMYRDIPMEGETTYEQDGQLENAAYSWRISNVSVDNNFETDVFDDIFRIQIGDADSYVYGEHTDTVSYRVNVIRDNVRGFDQFYYALVPNNWATTIDGLSFRIQMPHDFDEANLGFSVGAYGVSGYDESLLHYTVDGQVITGSYDGTLLPGEGVVVRIVLPEGYYTSVKTGQDYANMGMVISLIIAAVCVVLFLAFRRRQKPVVTVEFYPPEGFTSADVGFVVDGVAEDRDVLSLLIYWADKGYLRIREGEAKNEMVFEKLQDLKTEADDYQEVMFRNLFSSGDIVSTTQLENKFYSNIPVIKNRLTLKYTGENAVFQKSSQTMQKIGGLLASLPVTIMIGVGMWYEQRSALLVIIAAVVAVAFGMVLAGYLAQVGYGWESGKTSQKAKGIIGFSVGFAIYGAVAVLCVVALLDAVWPAFVGAGLTLLLMLFMPFYRKRTEKGLAWQGRILGLRQFIQTVELEKLKMMVEQDPAYFYNILPYAYVLGLSDKWAKQFESLAVQPPDWYDGGTWGTFSTVYFTSVMMRSMTHAQRSMWSQPSSSGGGSFGSSGGGGFSGGGFSGGGMGSGGGGGSW